MTWYAARDPPAQLPHGHADAADLPQHGGITVRALIDDAQPPAGPQYPHEDAVPPGPQAPQIRRPSRERLRSRGSSASQPTVPQSAAPPMGSVAVASVAPYAEDMSEMPISEASGHLDEVASESAATGEVIYLTRDGRRLAAIVPVEVAAEIEATEDAADLAAAEAAMAEPGQDVLAETVWAELGIADDE
jgi:antitoxin (DNA-binding transcriptional repressor) of toxin-antitoxin stability system